MYLRDDLPLAVRILNVIVEGLSDIYQLSAYMLYQCLETDISGLKEVTEII